MVRLLALLCCFSLAASACDDPVVETPADPLQLADLTVQSSDQGLQLNWSLSGDASTPLQIFRSTALDEEPAERIPAGRTEFLTYTLLGEGEARYTDDQVSCSTTYRYALYDPRESTLSLVGDINATTPDPVSWYLDEDGDGLGDPQEDVQACYTPGPDYVLQPDPCAQGPIAPILQTESQSYCIGRSLIVFASGVASGGKVVWEVEGDAVLNANDVSTAALIDPGSGFSRVTARVETDCGLSEPASLSFSPEVTRIRSVVPDPNGISMTPGGALLVSSDAARLLRYDSLSDSSPDMVGDFDPDLYILRQPMDVLERANGSVWAVDLQAHQLQTFDAIPGELDARLGLGADLDGSGPNQFSFPRGMGTDGTSVYIADRINNRIARITESDGTDWETLTDLPGGMDSLMDPLDVAVMPDGSLIIIDSGHERLVKVDDMTGANPEFQDGSTLDPVIEIVDVPQIAVSPFGQILISQSFMDRVIILSDFDGTSIEIYGETGSGIDQLDRPYGVAFWSHYAVIADKDNDRVVALPCRALG